MKGAANTRRGLCSSRLIEKGLRNLLQNWTPLLVVVVLLCLFTQPCSSKTKVHLHAIIPDHFTASRELEAVFVPSFLPFKRNFQYGKVFDVFDPSHNVTFLRFDDPMEILRAVCSDVLGSPTVTLVIINNPHWIRRRPDANTYVLDLAQTLGLPVISWDADFSGSPKEPEDSLALQIAPTIQHQARAIFSLLQRYNWTQFSVVTSHVAGYQQFLSTLQNLAMYSQQNAKVTVSGEKRKRFKVLQEVLIRDWRNMTDVRRELSKLSGTDTRIIVMHSSSGAECVTILEEAAGIGLTGREYQWILTQTAIAKSARVNKAFPIGTLGLMYNHELEAMKRALRTAVKIWFTALLAMSQRPANIHQTITFPQPRSCNQSDIDLMWKDGRKMYNYLQNIRLPREPQLQFDGNGTLRQTELIIINCQWHDNRPNAKKWQEVGRWMRHGLVMRDIVWPGGAAIPPSGMPARAFLRIATLEEKPYVMYINPNPYGKCSDHAVHCRIYERDNKKRRLSNTTIPMCCVGLSIDLLRVFSRELNFDFDLHEVEDGMWGAVDKATGRWNGPIRMLIDRETDMVITSLKINPDRAKAVRFSVPFLETGITIVVSLREGAISPTAFLEPFDLTSWLLILMLCIHVVALGVYTFEWFSPSGLDKGNKAKEPYDYPSWCLILVFSVHATGASIFIFEWLSPFGLNRGKTFYPDHKFSLFRSFWMIWAMLFSAAVDTDGPKGTSSRFLANIWALFALVFLASYTANLAAFMITKEEYYDLTGIQDWRSLGKSLSIEDTGQAVVQQQQQQQKRCRDQVCDTQIWRLKHQLDLAMLKIENLQNQISSTATSTTQPDITRQLAYQDSDYSRYNGAARRHTARDIFSETDRLLTEDNCDSRSEGGGTRRIRRSPSYTCAVGGDLLSDGQRLSNKSRHLEGKMYVGVDSSGNSSESVL